MESFTGLQLLIGVFRLPFHQCRGLHCSILSWCVINDSYRSRPLCTDPSNYTVAIQYLAYCVFKTAFQRNDTYTHQLSQVNTLGWNYIALQIFWKQSRIQGCAYMCKILHTLTGNPHTRAYPRKHTQQPLGPAGLLWFLIFFLNVYHLKYSVRKYTSYKTQSFLEIVAFGV